MKYLKMLAFAAVAAGALMTFAGTASATVLCRTTTTPCGEKWEINTEIFARLQPGTSATFSQTSGKVFDTCTEVPLQYTTENRGGSFETVSAELAKSSSVFGGCTKPVLYLSAGTIEIHQIAGSDNGTVTAKGLEFTYKDTEFGGIGSCTYSTGAAIDFGTLIGGGTPELEVNAVFPTKLGSFFCPSDLVWKGRFEIPQPPLPIYVEAQ